ncbi:MAG: hypothetical protein WBA98_03730 [Gordonia sp. (in: high G+C Gram-positive bacteria)]|uniref:hypothetical protein n=1 Tax=Gordonia sp. (in: high G+C Gram-positive bacteria) TaxID=84139 RepID=UPI003C73BF46
MASLPDDADIAIFRETHNVHPSVGRSSVIKMMLAEERRESLRDQARSAPLLDADYLCAGLAALQDAAQAAGLSPEVLVAAVPAVAQRLVAQAMTTTTQKKDTTR